MASTEAVDSPAFLRALRGASRSSLPALGVGVLAVVSGVATYAIISGLVPYQASHATLIWLLLTNLTFVLALGALVAWRLTRFWVERRSGVAGARLQARLVGIFSMIAVVPVIFVAIFAAVTLNLGIEQWFSTRVKDAITGSVNLASHYESEHEQTITRDALEIAYAVENDPQLYGPDQRVNQLFYARLADLAKDHDLRAFYVFGPQGQLLSHSDLQTVYILDPQGRVLQSLKQKALPPLPTAEAFGVRRGRARRDLHRCEFQDRRGARADPSAELERLSSDRAQHRSAGVRLLPAHDQRGYGLPSPRRESRETAAALRGALWRRFAADAAGRDLARALGRQPAGQADLAADRRRRARLGRRSQGASAKSTATTTRSPRWAAPSTA